jgi:hypothetical protein
MSKKNHPALKVLKAELKKAEAAEAKAIKLRDKLEAEKDKLQERIDDLDSEWYDADNKVDELNNEATEIQDKIDQVENYDPSKAVPEKGAFTAYKKVFNKTYGHQLIAVLEIPAKAKRVTPHTGYNDYKSRASAAKVVAFEMMDGSPLKIKTARGIYHNSDFVYKLGQVAKPEAKFDPCMTDACRSGIHFFMDRDSAVRY